MQEEVATYGKPLIVLDVAGLTRAQALMLIGQAAEVQRHLHDSMVLHSMPSGFHPKLRRVVNRSVIVEIDEDGRAGGRCFPDGACP